MADDCTVFLQEMDQVSEQNKEITTAKRKNADQKVGAHSPLLLFSSGAQSPVVNSALQRLREYTPTKHITSGTFDNIYDLKKQVTRLSNENKALN